MSLEVITIDFWNTLFDSADGKQRNAYRQRILIDEIDKFGISVMGNQFQEAMEATWKYFEDIWTIQHRTPTSLDCVEFIWDYLKIQNDKDSINIVKQAFEDSVLVHPPTLLPGAKNALNELSKNHSLALISDTGFSPGSILLKLMQRERIDHYFSSFSFSDETGVAKPHEKAFLTSLNQLDTHPHNALHIGDIEQTDITGAKNLGMKAIRFTGSVVEYINVKNPKTTQADHELGNWDDILQTINK